ncbi:alpha-ketoglutarate-dependent dioxygenase alkB homolog 7, mitochondrial-like isoform X1 [Diaphorina citri]|uniref:Alpha-ketoglutarate-dependent dioxygenase alkB homolog 7, mitochondrial-like isoform X1 n=1 Tax=Diaphorina citri TaxID=121845 RepID=A0A3Q0IZG0_DIACI|nr:alpha-ketoglutarate-dependent dioxygenase alkB homolog 7, mitochondrial-like isoform X1 [Diaphorina citri]
MRSLLYSTLYHNISQVTSSCFYNSCRRFKTFPLIHSHQSSTSSNQSHIFNEHCDGAVKSSILSNMLVINDFLSAEEEQSLLKEINQFIKRQRYEYDHWDDAIHGFRETERSKWNEENTKIIARVQNLAFPPNVTPIQYVHVLDLEQKGYIKAHVDSVRFCGNTIAGLSLLSDSVMKLVDEKTKTQEILVLLKQRSLYVMKDDARYKFTHEVLENERSYFGDLFVPRGRRISVICRNTPDPSLIDSSSDTSTNNNPYAR